MQVDEEYLQAPVFTDKVIFLKTGRLTGRLYSIGKATGKVLWRTDRNILGNVSVSDKYAFALTEDGKIIRISIETGNIETLVEFDNLPFVLDGDEWVTGYYVAFDQTTNMLFVNLGDSQQLFGFSVSN